MAAVIAGPDRFRQPSLPLHGTAGRDNKNLRRFANIAPVAERLATEFGMSAVMATDEPDNGYSKGADYWLSSTDRIIVIKNRKLLEPEALKEVVQPLKHRPGFRI